MGIEVAAEMHDRRTELEVLERLLSTVRGGQGRVLVITGEPGIGKTALVGSTIRTASGFRVMRAIGVESEMELPFAALQQLCAPMLDRLGRLPPPQRDALAVAFGLSAGDAPARFLVGLAVLSLMADWPRSSRFCVSWTTRSGLIGPRFRRLRLWHGGCWRSQSR